jgi:hypothetical protein
MTDNATHAPLAQPEPEGPTEHYIAELAEDIEWKQLPQDEATRSSFLLEFARAVIARCARPAIQPVAVAERPWEREGWCDAEGRCWWFNHAGIPEWQLASDGPYGDFSLPHHALPLPKPTQPPITP